ncbi:DUF1828 domain-containing protein [Lactococcus garvieae]|uniref:DUF1828 domain-containing protein n=1 Tax=Lactococcus garvieae TaxID=1363 RepID=UPI003854172F
MSSKDVSQEYFTFIRNNAQFNDITDTHTEIVTPFVDASGEGIGFSCIFDGSFYTITDDGYTLFNLDIYGIDLNKKGNRRDLFESLLKYNGFTLNDNKEIEKKVAKKDLGQAIHDMTQLLINVYDFDLLHPQTVYTQFLEDVKSYFLKNDKYVSFPGFSITGKSRLNHKFNFVFMSKGISKLTRVHNTITKQQVDNILSGWLDTTEYRRMEYGDTEQLYIIVSDEGYHNMKDDHRLALKQYGIEVLNFSNKEQLEVELGA